MRKITDHIANLVNDKIEIAVLDEPGAGGANHIYGIRGFSMKAEGEDSATEKSTFIYFQNGPINDVGINGVTQEALLAIVIDRLRSFQAGPFSCRENAVALTKAEESLMWLKKRTTDRMARGVEGTMVK